MRDTDMNEHGWEVIGGGAAEVTDYGLWIDGEMLSEKDELEGKHHE